MVEKNETYDNFLKSFRIAMTNASVYFKGHPLFVKSIDNLRNHISELLLLMNPLRMGIAPDSLSFGKDCLKGSRLYEEIATFFHHRKVKVITFREGINNEELISFLDSANLSPKDILFKGGLNNILEEADLGYITVEDLDYSQLLKDEGEEYGDIWLFLLKKSLKKDDSERINALANDFKKVLKKLQLQDLVENKEIRESISELFAYLKYKDANKFSQCSKELTKSVLKDGDQLNEGQIQKFKDLLKDVDTKGISDALLEQFQDSDKINPLSLNLFSKLLDRDKREGVTIFLTGRLEKEDQLKKDPKVVSGMKELISSLDFSSHESKMYYDNLSAILADTALGGGLRFNRDQVVENYRLVLLDLFVLELSSERLEAVLDVILGQLDKALEISDLKYIENFKKALAEKKEALDFKSIFTAANKKISAFVEEAIFNESYALDLEFLMDMIDTSSREVGFYFDRIFKEGRVSSYILKLFFKLFPNQLPLFCVYLDKMAADLRFIEELMKSLAAIKPDLSLEILKHIFSSANNFVKIKVLEKMEELGVDDKGFLFSVINKGEFLQRKQALSFLVKNHPSRSEAAQILLAIPNFFGLKSKLIEENLRLVGEVPFPEASAYLTVLSKYRFFWNRKIRIKAKEILKKNGI